MLLHHLCGVKVIVYFELKLVYLVFGKLTVLFCLHSMADHNLRSIKASQALKRAKDGYEASVSKRGKHKIEVLQEDVNKSRAQVDDSAINEDVDWLC